MPAPAMHPRAATMRREQFYRTTALPPHMMAPKPKNAPAGYRPEKPWTKAQGLALYAFCYALIGALIYYRQTQAQDPGND